MSGAGALHKADADENELAAPKWVVERERCCFRFLRRALESGGRLSSRESRAGRPRAARRGPTTSKKNKFGSLKLEKNSIADIYRAVSASNIK